MALDDWILAHRTPKTPAGASAASLRDSSVVARTSPGYATRRQVGGEEVARAPDLADDVHERRGRQAVDAHATAFELPDHGVGQSDAYRLVRTALSDRLTAYEAQRETALSTDVDGFLAP